MCGIITIIKKKDDGVSTSAAIKGMLQAQITRGMQGFGYVGFGDNVESYLRRETRTEIERALDKNTSRSMMFHHRWPTSTPNYADCTHPIKVSHKELKDDYYLIHNGVITNDHVLHQEHLALGYEYTTTVETTIKTKNHIDPRIKWNDSEALAIDVARFLEQKQDKIECRGSIAFICMRVDKKTGVVKKVFFGRNSSPLTIKITKDSLVLRSEGETDSIEPNKLYVFDMKTFKCEKADCQIGESISTRYHYDADEDPDAWKDFFRNSDYRPNYGTTFLPPPRSITSRIHEPVDIDTTADDSVYEPSEEELVAMEQASKIEDKISDINLALEELEAELAQYKNDGDADKYHSEISQISDEIKKMEGEKEILEAEYDELMYDDLDEDDEVVGDDVVTTE
jgi:hypothetical protein